MVEMLLLKEFFLNALALLTERYVPLSTYPSHSSPLPHPLTTSYSVPIPLPKESSSLKANLPLNMPCLRLYLDMLH